MNGKTIDALRAWARLVGYYHDSYNCDLPDNCGHCVALRLTCEAFTEAGREDLCSVNGYDMRKNVTRV